MTGEFDACARYASDRDVREFEQLENRLRDDPNRARIWPLIGSRRSGKTWALRRLASRLDGEFLDLRDERERLYAPPSKQLLLLDEPGVLLQNQPMAFFERCRELVAGGGAIVIAVTPAEWELLRVRAPGSRILDERDRLFLEPLSVEQAQALARTDVARRLLERLPDPWKRNPFILEFLFEVAEQAGWDVPDVAAYLDGVTELTQDAQHLYAGSVFGEGLNLSQRDVVRSTLKGQPIPDDKTEVLCKIGLLERFEGPARFRIADPLLDRYIPPPLIIHHLVGRPLRI